ncbi:unnamed protein product [Ilex paraguariensis]|uniref:Uncharacterized protein n=1 Tax=Ilex paraguariensis TaxID=185542 RepID=A0ABC8SRN4_9AQUA
MGNDRRCSVSVLYSPFTSAPPPMKPQRHTTGDAIPDPTLDHSLLLIQQDPLASSSSAHNRLLPPLHPLPQSHNFALFPNHIHQRHTQKGPFSTNRTHHMFDEVYH